jgi:cysteinyl-tRNA synthetase
LRLYDTSTRSVRDFVPRNPPEVTIYLCGATVQSPPHIGHVRNVVNFDLLRRWLTHQGYRVTMCRNVTDVEDKIIVRAAEEGRPTWEVAYRNERAFGAAYDLLGCLPPTVEPRATGHIQDMIALIERIVAAGHAYVSDSDVYFDVRSWPDYGALSRQKLDAVQPTEDPDTEGRKRDPRDFALWKAAKPGEPAWDSPWGSGRPGWHIECSAMSERYLGPAFDIHAGGVDLVFPHHENEIAQSRAAGNAFAAYWLHNAWVATAGEKMSKSLGNSMLVTEVVNRLRPIELRYYLAGPHYRSVIDASDESMDDAAIAFRRIEGFIDRATDVAGEVDPADAELPAAFIGAMDDDLSTPRALAVVHDAMHEGNKAVEAGDAVAAAAAVGSVRRMLGLLGLDPRDRQWQTGAADLSGVVGALVELVVAQRQAARERRDYQTADQIREQLTEAGVVVEDGPTGARWTLRRDV